MPSDVHDTPAMRQYRRFKEAHPECLLLFRMGDFYELFYEDARAASKALGITLTQRTEGIPMAGMPYHQLDAYLRRLLQAGFRVAVCDQVEDASQAKGLVKRDVTRLVTPGTLTDESLLDEASENPLAALAFVDDEQAALATAELSTGSFHVAELRGGQILDEVQRLAPRELLYVETADGKPPARVERIAEAVGCALTARPAWQFRHAEALEALLKQFNVATLAGFGFEDGDPVVRPAGAVVRYLLETQQSADGRLGHLRPPRKLQLADHLVIDAVSLRALEVERTMRTGQTQGSLLETLNDCRTAMGKRTLRRWLCFPLCDRERIEARQAIVAALTHEPAFNDNLARRLDTVQDIQRMASRLAIGRPSPRDLVGLGASVREVDALVELLAERPALKGMHEAMGRLAPPLRELGGRIADACVDTPPPHLREGGLIRDGYDAQLDEARTLQRDANAWLADYQRELIEETGVDRLKVGYNKVFGYYIEVTRAQAERMPDRFTRKQTLKNAERYITPKLKRFENDVLSAESKSIHREQALFDELLAGAAARLDELQRFASLVADLDVLACFARRAVRHGYVRPTIVDGPALHIEAGRHPVLDQALADQFVPNDVDLGAGDRGRRRGERGGGGNEGERAGGAAASDGGPGDPAPPEERPPSPAGPTLALITGPNMAGKSTYIRQTALLTLMAHTGSFIPADAATIGLTDRIFTRIGASDELHAGQSTFMVEMVETANICHHATERSMVILDEIGRGTSTLDGLSLAWAIAEHLAARRCRTLFATHYHELTALAERFNNVANLNVCVREWGEEIVFLHRIQPGATDRSYGIHVAKIAGLPRRVVERAHELMGRFELHTAPRDAGLPDAEPADPPTEDRPRPGRRGREPAEPSLFTQYLEHPATEKLREADLNAMSPIDAFDLLRQIKAELGD